MNLARATRALAGIAPRQLVSQPFVRAHNTDVLHVPLLLGEPRYDHLFDCRYSFKRGYRFNFQGEMPVLYLGCDKETSSYEIGPRTHEAFLGSLAYARSNPYLFIDVDVTTAVLDLTDRGVRRTLGVSKPDILIPTDKWESDMKKRSRSITHHLGALAWNDDRFGGILYPSYPAFARKKTSKKTCIALFMDVTSEGMATPRAPTRLVVVDAHGILMKAGFRF